MRLLESVDDDGVAGSADVAVSVQTGFPSRPLKVASGRCLPLPLQQGTPSSHNDEGTEVCISI